MPPRNSATRGAAIPFARLPGDGLGDEATQAFEIQDTGQLSSEAGGAGGEEQRILELATEDVAGKRGGRRAHGSSPRRWVGLGWVVLTVVPGGGC